MARRTSKYVNIEASESGDEYESGEYSEDIDNLAVAQPRPKSYSEFAREMEEKYMVSEPEDEGEYSGEEAGALEVPSQARLLPTPRSPLLFLVRCKIGQEREIADRIAESAKTCAAEGGGSCVYSVVQKDGLKGYLYVEAHKKQAVEDVLSHVKNVARNRLSVVPFGEMVEALTYRNSAIVSDFARVRGGKYNGDIVQVLENYDAVVKIKAVPRINGVRRLFDPEEHRAAVEKDGGYMFNRDFYQGGYMQKVVLKASLDFDAEPTFEELRMLGLGMPVGLNDTVKVVKGDLRSLVGKVVSISGNSAVVADEVSGRYEINVNDLEKYYSPGEMVSYKGVNGVILGMDNGQVVVGMNDFTEEVKVPVTALRGPVAEKKESVAPARAPRMRRNPLLNKKVRIVEGEFKGYAGVVKDVHRNACRVQLNSSLEFVTVPSDSLSFDAARVPSYAEGFSSGYLPSMKTPGYQTPGYKTPGYQTPGYKTPGYQTPGYKTPGYQTPGYKTPGYRGNPAEETETDWLRQPLQAYDGALVSVQGRTVRISDIRDGKYISSDGKEYARGELEFVQPQKYDNVVILEGTHAGTEGALVSIKGDGGTVKTADGESYQVRIGEISKKKNDNY